MKKMKMYLVEPMLQLIVIIIFLEVALQLIQHHIPEESKGYYEEFSIFKLVISVETLLSFEVIGKTLLTVVVSTFATVVISFFIGVIAFYFKFINSLLIVPLGEFFRAIPVTTLVPITTLAFNRGEVATVIVLACIPAVAIMTFYVTAAIGHVNELKVKCYKLNHTPNKWEVCIYHVMVALPSWFSGFKIIFSYSFVVVCVLEMLGMGPDGSAGKTLINNSNESAAGISNGSIAIIFWLGIIAFILNKIINNLDFYIQSRSFHQ